MIDVWLAVGEDGVAVLDYGTMHPTTKYPYESIITFGGCQVSNINAPSTIILEII